MLLSQGSIFPVVWSSQTIKITSKVALRTSEVLLNQNIFSKLLIWFYTFSLCSDSHPLKTFGIIWRITSSFFLQWNREFGRHPFDGVVFSTKRAQAQFFVESYETWQPAHQDVAFKKRVKQTPVPYTHQDVTFFRRCFSAFDGKKVTHEPLPFTGEMHGLTFMANWPTVDWLLVNRKWIVFSLAKTLC